jgi:hypothetical protein
VKKRLPRWAKWLAGIGGVVVLVLGVLALWFAAAMSGGFDNLLDLRHPGPDDRPVVRAGEAALVEARELAAELAQAGARAADTGPVLGTTGATECDRGQHNWKIDDDYDLRCSARGLSALQLELDQLAADVAAIEVALSADGWAPTRADVPPPDLSIAVLVVGGRDVGSYVRGEDRLAVRVLGPRGFYAGDTRYRELPPFRAQDGTETDAARLPEEAPPGRCTLLFEVQRVYFDE